MIIVPNNWADLQHYKTRSPPWIKLHKKLLDNYDFQCLHVASRALAPMLWLLASDHESGHVDATPAKLAFRLRMSEKEVVTALTPLIEKNFFSVLQDASNMLADCKQDAMPETETETETETEKDSGAKAPTCPHSEIIALYHECLPELPRVREWNDERQKLLRARWRSKSERQSLDWWRALFEYVKKSDFLMGRTENPLSCDLEWIVRPKYFARIIDGKYENRRAA